MEKSMEFPQEVKNRTIIWSSNFTSGFLSEENENASWKRYLNPYVHCSIIYNGQDMEATMVPCIDEWIETWYIYIQWNISHKKNEILPFVRTWMYVESIMLSETSQSKTDAAWSHLYVKSEKQMNKQNRNIHRYREWTGGHLRGGWRECGQNRWRGLRGTHFQL